MRPCSNNLHQGWKVLGIRQRLLVALILPLVSILLVGAFMDYRLARKTADEAFDQALADSVYDLETHVRKQTSPPYFDLTEETEAMLRSSAPDQLYFSIRDAAGKLLAGDKDLPSPKVAGIDRISFFDGLFQEQKIRGATMRMQVQDTEISITVLETTRRRQHSSQHILSTMTLQNLAVISVTLLAVFLGIRQGLQPLQELEREIAERSVSDLREIELSAAPREIRSLLHRLNELFGLLREAATLQQRFIGDAAHQLRTPLAGLQNQLDLAADEGLLRNNPGRLMQIEESMARIGHLLAQLLSYARAEHPGASLGMREPVALDQLVEKSATEFIDAALGKEIDLGFDIQHVKTSGYGWLLQEALANLVDNAIRYVARQGVITVRCGESSGRPFLEVEDDGPGIAEEYRQRVLERFYRIPGSQGNGCGLGLSIVAEIAKLHDASLMLDAGSNGGLKVRLEFPAGV
jgi:two-component system, OmpR family, sensor histidine kinase TctE